MAGWTAQVRALQAAAGTPGDPAGTVQQWFDGFAIPKAIVMCESGGNYGALNPSSGAGGAYQMLPETYKGLGGQVRRPAPGTQVRAGPPRRQAVGRRPRPRQLGVLKTSISSPRELPAHHARALRSKGVTPRPIASAVDHMLGLDAIAAVEVGGVPGDGRRLSGLAEREDSAACVAAGDISPDE